MADMIAMLDGLGAYGEKPIGDVDPRLLPSYNTASPQKQSWETRSPVANPPRPYTLGNEPSELDMQRNPGMTTTSKVLLGGGAALLLLWLSQKKSGPVSAAPGYPEPEMVKLEGAKRRRRRRKKK